MKKLFTLFSILLLFSTSCTEDGKDGEAYISIDWEYFDSEYKVSSYTDDNSSTPVTIDAGKNYKTQPGTYTYSYESEDYNYYYDHSGTYTIIINHGTEKTFFADGNDGADTYFELYLTVYKGKGDEKGCIANVRDEVVKVKGGYMVIHESVTIRSKNTEQ